MAAISVPMTPAMVAWKAWTALATSAVPLQRKYRLRLAIPARVPQGILNEAMDISEYALHDNRREYVKVMERLITEHREWLEENYDFDRLFWIVECLDCYEESLHDIPPVQLRYGTLTMAFNAAQWYYTIRGPNPEWLPAHVSYFRLLRHYLRKESREHRDRTCRNYFKAHPEAIESLDSLRLPDSFREIATEVEPQELYAYGRRHGLVKLL